MAGLRPTGSGYPEERGRKTTRMSFEIKWKPIEGFEQQYMVSNTGDIYSIRKKRILTPKITRSGYCRVGLSVNGKVSFMAVHRLVAKAFVPNIQEKPTVNHKNENKLDNRAENLEWMTNKEQNTYGTRIERAKAHTDYKARRIDYALVASKHNYHELNKNMQIPVIQMNMFGKQITYFNGISEASKKTGINAGHICECAKGKRKHAGGYKWKYAS